MTSALLARTLARDAMTPPDALTELHLADTSVWSKARSNETLRDWLNASVAA